MEQINGYVFDIQRYSIHDGPGIRSTVFLKGCPLTCAWCSNPESQKQVPQLLYMEQLCSRCHKCVNICPNKAIKILPEGALHIDRDLCVGCGFCVDICPAEARKISGKLMSVEEVIDVVKRDALFYKNSDGGVTFSGGEATAQPDFLLALLKECKKLGFHTTLDTCGFVKWEVLEPILEYVDLVLFDVKQINAKKHQQLTGVSNKLISENAKRIVSKNIPIILRAVLIPGCNDSDEDIKALAEFALELDCPEINLMLYHKLGIKKYESLGMQYNLGDLETYPDEKIEHIKDQISLFGLTVKVQ
ncbi:MAG: glycyl-radical enzyme activating protein [Proteobacteria bacterium]|nr:glycyl-radical enzyme activating protein [Pseudomonadota bacterium]